MDNSKHRLFPLVILYAAESTASFDFWLNRAKEAFEASGFRYNNLRFGIDGGAFFKWLSKSQCPMCSCGPDQWASCDCAGERLYEEARVEGPVSKNLHSLSEMRVSELQGELKRLRMNSCGKKEELLGRLAQNPVRHEELEVRNGTTLTFLEWYFLLIFIPCILHAR